MEKLKSKLNALKKLIPLWPAFLTIIIVALVLQCTAPTLLPIPDKLKNNKTETKTETPVKQLSSINNKYADGTYVGSSNGYGGEIKVQVTVENGQIKTVEILDASKETAAYLNLAKKVIDSVISAQTWEVDVVSGATYSSKGILGAIQNALTNESVNNESVATSNATQASEDTFVDPSSYTDGTYSGSAQGFGGTISVNVTVKDGKIDSIDVTDHSGETDSYYNQASQVIQSIISAQSPNVDVVSGATYSSTGIINAVKRALSSAAQDENVQTETSTQTNEEIVIPTVAVGNYTDGTYTGIGTGYGGDIEISAVIKEGILQSIEIVNAKQESASYLEKAKAIIKDIIESQSTDVDTVSGATFSSNGILDAVKNALCQADTTSKYMDGTYSASTKVKDDQNQWDAYPVTAYVTIQNGKIDSITCIVDDTCTDQECIDAFNLAADGTKRQYGVLDQIILNQTSEVDTVSSATETSNSIMKAVSKALKKALNPYNKENQEEIDADEEVEEDTDTDYTYADGLYTVTSWVNPDTRNQFEAYPLELEIQIEKDRIVSIEYGNNSFGSEEDNETNYNKSNLAMYGTSTKTSIPNQFINRKIQDIVAEEYDVDIVSSATCTSKAIIDAVQYAISMAGE